MWCKFLREVGNGLLWYRFRFTSTRAHEVPLHSTSRAHILTASLQGANRCVGVPPPTPPLMGIHHHLFQPSALRSCHVAADAVIQDTPPAFSSPKILVSLWNHLSLHQSRPRSQPTESQLCQRITLEGSETTPNFILDNWLFSLRSQRGWRRKTPSWTRKKKIKNHSAGHGRRTPRQSVRRPSLFGSTMPKGASSRIGHGTATSPFRTISEMSF